MAAKLEADDLSVIPTLDRPTLIDHYRKLYGSPPPLRLSRKLIMLAIAYRLQEQVHGGLDPAVRRQLMNPELATRPRATTGTVLIREWQGEHHTVTVSADAVEYRGERFESLSAVAGRITGQKRSGPAFFGVQGKRRGE